MSLTNHSQTHIEEAGCLVLEPLEAVVAEVDLLQADKGLEGARGDPGQVIGPKV